METLLRVLITLLRSTHEPPSRVVVGLSPHLASRQPLRAVVAPGSSKEREGNADEYAGLSYGVWGLAYQGLI